MKKTNIFAYILLAFIISFYSFPTFASTSKVSIKKHTAVKTILKKKAKKSIKKKVIKRRAEKLDLNPPLIDPNNPPSSPKPTGQ